MIPRRLKEARTQARLSQENLGFLIGLPKSSASARMNQYELGKHCPSFELIKRIAAATDKPVSWFYTEDDAAAEAQIIFANKQTQVEVKPS